jgi:small neutral amino acid transporter SnatA (MarC family)
MTIVEATVRPHNSTGSQARTYRRSARICTPPMFAFLLLGCSAMNNFGTSMSHAIVDGNGGFVNLSIAPAAL